MLGFRSQHPQHDVYAFPEYGSKQLGLVPESCIDGRLADTSRFRQRFDRSPFETTALEHRRGNPE